MDEAEIDINKQKTEVWYYILNYSLDVFDLKNDERFFKILHLSFSYQIDVLKDKFEKEPIVLFHEDLKSNPKKFIKQFCSLTFSDIDLEKVNFNEKHISYSEKQLKAIKVFSKYFNLKKEWFLKVLY